MDKNKDENADQKRQEILDKGLAMQRLLRNSDFIIFIEDLNNDRRALINGLLNENSTAMADNTVRTRMIARINQIDRLLQKPQQAIRIMKALKEVREATEHKNNPRAAGAWK